MWRDFEIEAFNWIKSFIPSAQYYGGCNSNVSDVFAPNPYNFWIEIKMPVAQCG